MSEIILTKDQEYAVGAINSWYNRDDSKQVFTLAGYAGCGKSFLIKYIVDHVLNLDQLNIKYVAPTGKAATVLIQKELPATTIHKLIYTVNTIVEDILQPDGTKVRKKKVVFTKREKLCATIKLIIVDEVSMVNKKLMEDLLSYDIKVLAVGDIGQLPPIGESHGYLKDPDAVLEEPVRFELENPIVKLATEIRQGKPLPIGRYSDNVHIYYRNQLSPYVIDSLLLNAEQVLCGRNNTRISLNKRYRELKYNSVENNIQHNEKLICLHNNWSLELEEYFLVNGMSVYVTDATESDNLEDVFIINCYPDFLSSLDLFEGIPIYKKSLNAVLEDKTKTVVYRLPDGDFVKMGKPPKREDESEDEYRDRLRYIMKYRNEYAEEQLNYFDYGYAITVHKSQGSEWDRVLLFAENIMRTREDYIKWLYTAITRTKEKLVIII